MKIIRSQNHDSADIATVSSQANLLPRWRVLRLIGLVGVLGAILLAYHQYQASLPETYRKECESASRDEDWEKAEYWAKLWVKTDPNNGEGWLALSDALQSQEKWQALADALAHFPVTDRRALKVMTMRGDLLVSELKDIVAAKENALQVLKIEPRDVPARQRLTYIYSMTLQRKKLAELLKESIRLQAEPRESYYYLFSMENLGFTDGLLVTTDWLKQRPDYAPLQIAQAIFSARTKPGKSQELFKNAGLLAGDLSLLERCKEKYPQDVEINAYEIYQAMILGEIDTVRKLLGKLDINQSNDCRIWRYQAWLLKNENKLDEALACCRQANKINPLDWRTHLDLAELERIASHKEESARHAQLASRGKALEMSFQALRKATDAPYEQMKLLYEYIRDCGDEDIAIVLAKRLNLITNL